MGLSSSPYIFSKLSDFVVRCMVREGHIGCVDYLNNFCMVCRNKEAHMDAQWALLGILGRIGFFVSLQKLLLATTVSKFLGIKIDSDKLDLPLLADKLPKFELQLKKFARKWKASKLELEALGEYYRTAARWCMVGGRSRV